MADEQQGVEALENIIAALQSNNPEILDRCDDALRQLAQELDHSQVPNTYIADRLAELAHLLVWRSREIRESRS